MDYKYLGIALGAAGGLLLGYTLGQRRPEHAATASPQAERPPVRGTSRALGAEPEQWTGKVALITGASIGIGAEVAVRMAAQGIRVAGCARSLERLQATRKAIEDAGGEFLPIQCELTDEESVLAMFAAIKAKWGGVDILVNNAGHAHEASLLEGETRHFRSMLDLNVTALCAVTREAVRDMRSRPGSPGFVIHISSMSGHRIVGTGSSFYAATKYAVRALTEGLRRELRAVGADTIRCAQISPGLVETDFARRFVGPDSARKLYETSPTLVPSNIADAVLFVLNSPLRMEVHDVLMRPTLQAT